ncbi:MAG: hypothetical protein U1E27_14385 [Kiritimatiellia bacterium]|nr:hypothetical protein [Kiritimatiellia bacterium]
MMTLTVGCRSVHESGIGPRDDLVGWYHLPNRHYRTREILPGPGTLIPVLKMNGAYYSVCRGVEVPLLECEEGLEWGALPSSLKGTKIGRDPASREIYIVIEDSRAQYEGDYSVSGEKQGMTKIDRPTGLLDPTTTPPRSSEDFVGCYLSVWFPYFRWMISRQDEVYQLKWQSAEKEWKSESTETVDLIPLTDTLGFMWGRKKEYRMVYNPDLHRFECLYGDPGIRLRMPLTRIDESLPPGSGIPSPRISIGIPSWH